MIKSFKLSLTQTFTTCEAISLTTHFPKSGSTEVAFATINKDSSRGYLGEWALYVEGITGQKFAASGTDSFIINLGKPKKERFIEY